MKGLALFFPSLFADPQVGDEYVHDDLVDDPWREGHWRVVKQSGNWYQLRYNGNGTTMSKRKNELVAFYTKVGHYYPSDDFPPF